MHRLSMYVHTKVIFCSLILKRLLGVLTIRRKSRNLDKRRMCTTDFSLKSDFVCAEGFYLKSDLKSEY